MKERSGIYEREGDSCLKTAFYICILMLSNLFFEKYSSEPRGIIIDRDLKDKRTMR